MAGVIVYKEGGIINMSRYDNIFNDMSNINITNRMQGSGYTNTVKNFGYNTDADKRVNLNKKVEDDYKPESMKPFSHMTVIMVMKIQTHTRIHRPHNMSHMKDNQKLEIIIMKILQKRLTIN